MLVMTNHQQNYFF